MTSIAVFTVTRSLVYPALDDRMHPLRQYFPLPPSERIGFRQVQKLERVLSRSIFELAHTDVNTKRANNLLEGSLSRNIRNFLRDVGRMHSCPSFLLFIVLFK